MLAGKLYCVFVFAGFLGQCFLGVPWSGWSSQAEEWWLAVVSLPERIWHQPSHPDHRHTTAELTERVVVSAALHHASQVSGLVWHTARGWCLNSLTFGCAGIKPPACVACWATALLAVALWAQVCFFLLHWKYNSSIMCGIMKKINIRKTSNDWLHRLAV